MRCEKLLLDDKIIKILIGDTSINKDIVYPITMPYLSGKKICDIANNMGMSINYNDEMHKGYSRKQYMYDTLKYCIDENKISELFNEITKKNNFKYLVDNSFIYHRDSNMQYYKLIEDFYFCINELLGFDDAYLIHKDNIWKVQSFDEEIKIEVPEKEVDLSFIGEEYSKALRYLDEENYQHSITICRTLLEDVFVKMLNKKNIKFKQNGEIKNYYKLIKENYNLKTESDIDKSINELFSSLEGIVNAITEIRNKASDSHAFQNKDYKLKEYHIKLFINSSVSISVFLIELMNENDK